MKSIFVLWSATDWHDSTALVKNENHLAKSEWTAMHDQRPRLAGNTEEVNGANLWSVKCMEFELLNIDVHTFRDAKMKTDISSHTHTYMRVGLYELTCVFIY